MPIVEIPGHGDVEFPDSMKDEDILAVIRRLSQPPTPAAPGPGKTEAFFRGAGQGATLGFGDEMAAGVGSGLQKVLPESMGGIDYGKGFLQLYHENRDALRRENKAAEKAHPGIYVAGNLVGSAPLAMATGGGGAAGLAASSAALGGASALGESEAQDVGGNLADAGKGAAAGLLLAGGLRGLGKAVAPLGRALDKGAVGTARRVLANVTGSLSDRLKLSDEAVREALHSGVVRLGGTSEGAAGRLEGLRGSVGDQYGQIVAELEKAGITGPDAQALAQKYAAQASASNASTMNPAVPRVFEQAAEQVSGKPTIFAPGQQSANRLPLSLTEDLKRSLQDQARAAYRQLQPNEVARAHEAAASMMRQSAEDEIAQQTAGAAPDVQAMAAQFAPVKDRLGRIIEASNAAREGMNRAGKRQAFSLTDALMASGGLAHGGPLEAGAAGVASHILRKRGPSTAARLMDMGAQGADWLTGPAVTPAQQRAQYILDILQRRGLPLAGEEAGALTQ